MRSWRRLALAALLAAGCGDNTDVGGGGQPIDPDACETSYLDYTSFGEPFLLDWCNGCHSAGLPANMRQMAPAGVNFDSIEGVRQFQDRIAARGAGATPTMPPAGGPSAEERALLAEWIACGAK
jgi:uncharacterized membrane protein